MIWKDKLNLQAAPIQGACDCSPEKVQYNGERLQVLNQHIQSMIEENKISSGAYCLSRYGKVFAHAALGDKASTEERFDCQSITKMMTAVAVLKLAEDGVLHLEQPVCQWIPEFAVEEFEAITILQCLTHTSGLVGFTGTHGEEDVDWFSMVDETNVAGTWIPAIVKAGLRRKPGEEWSYSMAGFLILGEIIAHASGMPAEDFIRETILIPCDMQEARWTDDTAMIPWPKEVPGTACGLICTLRELVQFGEMILNGGTYNGKRVIGKTALEYVWTDMIQGKLLDYCWDHPGNPVSYGAGVPMFKRSMDQQQLVTEGTLYHEGHGACMLLIDREEQMVAAYRTKFVHEEEWFWEAVKGTTSVIWSGVE